MQKKTVTLVEVLVAAIILSIAAGGLIATFVSVRRYVSRAQGRLVVASLARDVIHDLEAAIRDGVAAGNLWPAELPDTGGAMIDTPEQPAKRNNTRGAGVTGTTYNRWYEVIDHADSFREVTVRTCNSDEGTCTNP